MSAGPDPWAVYLEAAQQAADAPQVHAHTRRLKAARKAVRGLTMPCRQYFVGSPLHRLGQTVDAWIKAKTPDHRASMAERVTHYVAACRAVGVGRSVAEDAPPVRQRKDIDG